MGSCSEKTKFNFLHNPTTMMKKIALLSFVFFAMNFTSSAQDNPFRIGLKFGMPNIAGLNAEYVTPLLGGRLAPSVDFSYISAKIGGTEATFSYFSLGGNLYLKEGKGPYAHVGYSNLNFEGTFKNNGEEGTGSIGLNLLNIKVGAKLGKRFYFRPEIGWGVLMGDSEFKVEYASATTTEKVPAALAGGLLINSGFGFAF